MESDQDKVTEAKRILQQMRARARWAAVSKEERVAHGKALAAARWKAREGKEHGQA